MPNSSWPFPGSRWWKFDFHTHTPASRDTTGWQSAIGTPEEITPEKWLLRYMAAEIDCVVIADHNTGEWINRLKTTYNEMKQANAESPLPSYRELHLFPGVEISVQGGWHLLAIFGPSETTEKITRLLGRIDYRGTHGDSDGVTRLGAAEVAREVIAAGGLAIPAHADQEKGLLKLKVGSRSSRLDPDTLRSVLDEPGIMAMEWCELALETPSIYEERHIHWARVLGSDCHSFQGSAVPGSRFTWVKMATPTLEGLRLALLDGNDISIRRSDDVNFEAFRRPKNYIERIEIDKAWRMGNGRPQVLEFTPYYNALIGGRGTGKSTTVHALRLALRRDNEVLQKLDDEAAPNREFKRFRKVAQNRNDEGAMRSTTEICLYYSSDGASHRLHYRANEAGPAVEDFDSSSETWQTSTSQAITPERFPVRIFSQGQIAELAGNNRQALLAVIDEAAPSVQSLTQRFEEAKRSYMSLRAQQRELEGRLNDRPETLRKLGDSQRKLSAFEQSHHADVLMAFQRAQRQQREVDELLERLRFIEHQIEEMDQGLLLDDWLEGVFDSQVDADALEWRSDAQRSLDDAKSGLFKTRKALTEAVDRLSKDPRLGQWRSRKEAATTAYEELKSNLATQGVEDPQEFGRLVQERQLLEAELKQLDERSHQLMELRDRIREQWQQIVEHREAISTARSTFLADRLAGNEHVRIEVARFGNDPRQIETSLRLLLDAPIQFANDIRTEGNDGQTNGGLAHELAMAVNREATLGHVKQRLQSIDAGLGGHLRNHLERKLTSQPEYADHIQCWFPEDDLDIKYSRGIGSGFVPIGQGSAGQRAAALLAFLLTFGEEPLILDQPEDDLDNQMIYELIVRQIKNNKLRRQLIIVTHNPNIVVNGDAELVHAFEFLSGQCLVRHTGALQDKTVRDLVCDVMEGGREAFTRRWARLGREV